ncbi:unnamed protein product [Rangifer tarandus platyrhynchus]|uniref:Uncharacterized protein n=1 Tax=Rangifer tarandus platyrhynchus TaxID=3082113 RepID=A0AC60A264_RANTA
MRSQSRDLMVPTEGAAPADAWIPELETRLRRGRRDKESGARSGRLTGHPREYKREGVVWPPLGSPLTLVFMPLSPDDSQVTFGVLSTSPSRSGRGPDSAGLDQSPLLLAEPGRRRPGPGEGPPGAVGAARGSL